MVYVASTIGDMLEIMKFIQNDVTFLRTKISSFSIQCYTCGSSENMKYEGLTPLGYPHQKGFIDFLYRAFPQFRLKLPPHCQTGYI